MSQYYVVSSDRKLPGFMKVCWRKGCSAIVSADVDHIGLCERHLREMRRWK